MNVSVDTLVTMPNVAGIRNVGNTCYLAASLQAMASSPILVQHVTALADTMKRSQRAKKKNKHELLLAGRVAAELRAVYKFLVTGPEEAEVHHASLVATAAEGRLTQQLAALLTTLQPQHSSSPAAVDPSGLLSALASYTPEGVLQQGYQHDTAEAFEAVMDAVITEWTCWHQCHGSCSSSSQQAVAAGLKQLTQPTEARDVIYQPDPPPDQLPQQLFVLGRSQREQLLHGDAWLQHGSHCRCNDTGSNVGNVTWHHDATQQQQQQQDCSALQQRLEQQQQQQQCVAFPRLPVIGHTVDLITCCDCGFRFPRSLTPFVSLPLALPVSCSPSGSLSVPWGVDLQYCLGRYSQTEVVEGVECLKCSLRASLAAAAAPAATLAVDGDAVSNSGFTPAVGDSSCHQSGCGALQQERHDVQQLQPDTGSDACGIICAARGLDGACYGCQQQNSHRRQQLKQKQQRLLSQLTSLSTLTTPLPPLDYQQLLQQSGLAWLSCRRDVVKASRLAKAPRVLVIQLQRSLHTATGMGKVQGHVKFPMQLDLMEHLLVEQQQQQQDGHPEHDEKVQQQDQEQQLELEASRLHQKQPHMGEAQHKHEVQLQHAAISTAVKQIQQQVAASSKSTTAAPLVYDCTAVVQHLGAGQASGHYIMYRKASRWVGCGRALQPSVQDHEGSVNGLAAADCSSCSDSNRVSHCWLRVNDSTVCPADEQEVLQCHATLLVYERCA